VTRTPIALARGGAGLDGLRIAFLSDVHAGNFLDEDDFLTICARVQREAPDLICLGGDLVNLFDSEVLFLRKGLSLLQAPLGVVAVPNHSTSRRATRGCGARCWRSTAWGALNRGKRLERGASLWLCGVDDLLAGGRPRARARRQRARRPVVLSRTTRTSSRRRTTSASTSSSPHHGGQILLFGKTPLRRALRLLVEALRERRLAATSARARLP
jgi:predicted MPP superfamily phosphohydrolase